MEMPIAWCAVTKSFKVFGLLILLFRSGKSSKNAQLDSTELFLNRRPHTSFLSMLNPLRSESPQILDLCPPQMDPHQDHDHSRSDGYRGALHIFVTGLHCEEDSWRLMYDHNYLVFLGYKLQA